MLLQYSSWWEESLAVPCCRAGNATLVEILSAIFPAGKPFLNISSGKTKVKKHEVFFTRKPTSH